MSGQFIVKFLFAAALGLIVVTVFSAEPPRLHPPLAEYVTERLTEFDEIDAERKKQLTALAEHISQRRRAKEAIKLTFICTHNSRRSHLAQMWASVAAARFNIEGVETFSGGTAATALNPRTVRAFERAGFKVEREKSPANAKNPHYQIEFATGIKPSVCFSKVYNMAPNPTEGFCAVMTCSQADESCPQVAGSVARLAIPYEDPKVSDDTAEEIATYDERCAQIAREMLFVFQEAERMIKAEK
ncbi:MAG: protein-tyrosine-phosphatase [Pirellulales bacterium]|nr:protein-tyrosine-phosphatase [Pirellulales bacterium]